MSTNESGGGRASVRQPAAVAVLGNRPTFGAVPQVSLLPVEIRDAGSAARHRRRLVMLVVAAAVVAGLGVALATDIGATATARLAAANAQTTGLNAQVAKFSDIQALQQQIALGKAAVKVGGSTIVDWNAQLGEIEAGMPAGYTVTAISAAAATPMTDFPQGTTSLEPRRAATVVLTVTSASVGDEFSVWLRQLRSIPAYADVNASLNTADGVTTITLTAHLTAKAITAAAETE